MIFGHYSTKLMIDWDARPPEQAGLNPKALDDLRDIAAAHHTKALLIMRHNHIVYEWYAPGHDLNKRHYTASLAKAIVGGLSLGMSMQESRIQPDDLACQYIPAWRDDPMKSKITIRHLATHTSGIEDTNTPGKGHFDQGGWKEAFWRHDPDPFTVTLAHAPLLFEPGTGYAYSNPGMAALAYAVTVSLQGTPFPSIKSLLKARIFDPLGLPDESWSISYDKDFELDGMIVHANWGGGGLTARATARIGQMMLNGGTWQGQTLIEPEIIQQLTTYAGMPVPPRSQPGSGLCWWMNFNNVCSLPQDAYAGAGAGNQHLIVVPSLDMVVVRNGELMGDETWGEGFWKGAEQYLFAPLMKAVVGDI